MNCLSTRNRKNSFESSVLKNLEYGKFSNLLVLDMNLPDRFSTLYHIVDDIYELKVQIWQDLLSILIIVRGQS